MLREVPDEAWEYICDQRARFGSPEHYVFGRLRERDSVLITVTVEEDKSEIVRVLCYLKDKYGIQFDYATQYIWDTWTWEVQAQRETYAKRVDLKTETIRNMAQIIRYGCARCRYFVSERNGDDMDGYCKASGELKRVGDTPWHWEDGETVDGVRYMGQRYYSRQNSGCIYTDMEVLK